MLLFAEKVVLGAVVPLLVLIATNPMKFDGHERIATAIITLAIGYLVAHEIQKHNQAKIAPARIERAEPSVNPRLPAPPPQPTIVRHKPSTAKNPTLEQHSTGAYSPNVVTGDNSKGEINGKEEH